MKSAVVTGAASGIGLALTTRLLSEGWSVAALVRDTLPDHPELRAASDDGRLRIYRGDLADARSRQSLVAAIADSEPAIDVLFNNAGVSTGSLQLSPQGLELHFEVNCVAPYVLAEGLSAKLASGGRGRVVNTVSDAFRFLRRFDPESLAHPTTFRKVIGPYASSKLALALWSKALAPDLARRGIRIVSVAPGPNDTPLVHGPGFPALLRPLARLIAKPPSFGAGLLLDAATMSHEPGAFIDRGRVRPLPFEAQGAKVLALVAAGAEKNSA